jgi:hypothetical protein
MERTRGCAFEHAARIAPRRTDPPRRVLDKEVARHPHTRLSRRAGGAAVTLVIQNEIEPLAAAWDAGVKQ